MALRVPVELERPVADVVDCVLDAERAAGVVAEADDQAEPALAARAVAALVDVRPEDRLPVDAVDLRGAARCGARAARAPRAAAPETRERESDGARVLRV